MNIGYIHLVTNHLPIIGIPVALAFYLFALKKPNQTLLRYSTLVLSLLLLSTVIVFFTGEPAEDAIESINGVLKSSIEDHEEIGKIAFIFASISGALGLFTTFFKTTSDKPNIFHKALAALTLLTILLLGWTGLKGGKIRHTEFNSNSAIQDSAEKHD
ncbi:MAG: hypothetical protein KA715_14835 [Xanthomonadaceae bacterium]|nr:hypothetical protein [Xanthomonadaceae bacterium]